MSDPPIDELRQELNELPAQEDLSMSAIYMLPKTLTRFLSWLIREQSGDIVRISAYFDDRAEVVMPILESLAAKGFVEQIRGACGPVWRVRLQGKTRPSSGYDG